MATERIKMFHAELRRNLEDKVNSWLQESDVEIIDLKYGTCDNYHNCLIVYEPILLENDIRDKSDERELVTSDPRTPYDAANKLFVQERQKIEAMCYNRFEAHLADMIGLNCFISNAYHHMAPWHNIELFFSYPNMGNYKENVFHIKVTGKTYPQAYELFMKEFESKANELIAKGDYVSRYVNSNSPSTHSPILN